MTDASPAKRVGRAAAYPMIRLLDGRFADVVRRLVDLERIVGEEGARTREAVAQVEPLLERWAAVNGESLAYVGTQLRELADELRAPAADPEPAAADGPAAFALRAAARLPAGARIVDLFGARRPLGAQLATLGYRVLGADPRPYAHEHPQLETFPGGPAELRAAGRSFDAAMALDGAGPETLAALGELLEPGGLVVAALATGDEAPDEPDPVDALFEGWQVHERLHLREHLPGLWVPVPDLPQRGIVLAAATR